MNEHDKIVESLKPLFKEAREKSLWFHCNYQDLWFSPDELEKHQSNGQFMWGAVNWQLKEPSWKIRELELKKKAIDQEINNFVNRL